MSRSASLEIELRSELPLASRGDSVAICVFTDGARTGDAAGDRLKSVANAVVESGEFKGEAETSLLIHSSDRDGDSARAILLVGLGELSDFNSKTINRAAAVAARSARDAHISHLSFILPPSSEPRRLIQQVAEGALVGLYENGFYKADENEPNLERLTIISTEGARDVAIDRARIVADAVNWARTLADEPGGKLPPIEFARRAALMADEFGLTVESLDANEIKARGMGGLWGVGRGSHEPPALIVVRYEPAGASRHDELWAFVGKGITFDTGGISIKHGLDMYEMKTDMAGGAAVLGLMRVIAQLKPARRAVAIVPSAENMPSGSAIKPGDVINTLAGYTIEVVDTDAEGRLVLADGIAYAKQLGATRIVDVATLTGSIIVALGAHRAGLFSNNDAWASEVTAAADRAGEPVWRMPFSDDYKKPIESLIADFKNYGGAPDATAAALLLSKFAGDTPWVHLDIAGTSWMDETQPYAPKGSTGAGVRTLVELVCEM